MQTQQYLEDELKNFLEIAQGISPSADQIPQLAGIDIHGEIMPLHGHVGGDHIIYIDFNRRYDLDARIRAAKEEGRSEVVKQLRLTKRRAGILIADVAGHRATDAMIAAMLHQAFLLGTLYELDIFGEITTRLFEHVNTRFFRTASVHKYFTMLYGEISDRGGFRFLSAGHQPPRVFSREYGRFMTISDDRLVSVPPVGMLPSAEDPDEQLYPSLYGYKRRYTINEINLLAPGDMLLLHTDGLSEHAGGKYFPTEIERLLRAAGDEAAADICARIREEVLSAGPIRDDISFVVIKKL